MAALFHRGRILPRLRPRPFCSVSPTINERDEPESDTSIGGDDLRSWLFRLRFPKRSVTEALEKWKAEGRPASATVLRQIAGDLRRCGRYKHALEISEWMKTRHELDLTDTDYALRIDLITKVFGPNSAEEFFKNLPNTVKSSEVYTSLLHSFAASKNTQKAEEIFEEMKIAKIPINLLVFNEMLTLYISVKEFDKVPILIAEMKEQGVSLDIFSYNLWVSACAANLDFGGVRKILSEMGSWEIYKKLTEIYVDLLAETGADTENRERITYDFLIILYTELSRGERVKDIWESMKVCGKLNIGNYVCIISCYLVLGKLKETGDVIDRWRESKREPRFDLSVCNFLFDGFMKVGLEERAERFRELMFEKKCIITGRG